LELILTSPDHQETSTVSSTSDTTSSAITNESRSSITYENTETWFKEVLWRSLGNLINHCLELYLDTRCFFVKNSFNHSIRGQGVYPKQGMFVHPYFSTVQLVLASPRHSFRLTKTSSHGNLQLVLARPRTPFGLAETSLLNDYFCTNARTGSRCLFLWANRDIFA
jgi:hypothetical protein